MLNLPIVDHDFFLSRVQFYKLQVSMHAIVLCVSITSDNLVLLVPATYYGAVLNMSRLLLTISFYQELMNF